MIKYTKRINTKREYNTTGTLSYAIESDRGRVITSAAFRRLQKRTQVFALELNAAVRTRLTHSLEVQQSARYIAMSIYKELKNQKKLKKTELKTLKDAFVSNAEVASLLHDIGNPPFGHFAEVAINQWMSTKGRVIANRLFKQSQILQLLLKDLENFDGNAQALRVVHKLQKLNLTYSQMASIIKYTRAAYQEREKNSYLRKKPGYYYSEKDIVKEIYKALDMKTGCRFPTTYIMEAADDISYLSADIEDAIDKGLLTQERLYKLILKESKAYCKEHGIKENILKKIAKKAKKSSRFFISFRVDFINILVKYVTEVYIKNHQSVFDGSFDAALLEADIKDPRTSIIKVLQKISIEHIYNNKEVGALELKGDAIISGLLKSYGRILELNNQDMHHIRNATAKEFPQVSRLYQRLSTKHKEAYLKSISDLKDNSDELEWYYRVRLIFDHISGMTDDYALQEYHLFEAI
jgi:dGTPase